MDRAGRGGEVMAKPAFFADEDFLDRLLRLLSRSKSFAAQHAHLLQPDDFAERGVRGMRARWIVAIVALRHYQKHGTVIGTLLRSAALDYVQQTGLDEAARQEVEAYVKKLRKLRVDAGQREWIAEHVSEFKTQQDMARKIDQMIDLHGAGELTPEKMSSLTDEVTANAPTTDLVTGASLFQTEFPEQRFLMGSMLPKGVGMLAARPKLGKTWLMLQASVAVVRGKPFLGSRVRIQGPILYVALEDGKRRFAERLRLLTKKTDGLEDLHVLHSWDGVPGLRRQLGKTPYALIVVDPFLATLPDRRRNDIVRDDYANLQPFRRLAEDFDTTIVLVHHTRKQAGNAIDTVLGTTGTTAAVDTLWTLTRRPESDRVVRLDVTGRDVEQQTLEIEFKAVGNGLRGWRKVAEGPEAQAGLEDRKIPALLREHGPLAPKDIAIKLDKKPNAVRQTLKRPTGTRIDQQEKGRHL